MKTYRLGSKVQFNNFWHGNVYCGGSESSSPIPGGTQGTVIGMSKIPGVYLISTSFGTDTAHVSYIEPVKNKLAR